MKASHFLKFFLVLFCFTVLSQAVSAQEDMKKPDPVKNATIDMLLGTWATEPYEMMGSNWTQTATHSIKHGQYMFIDISGSDDKGSTYTSTIIIEPKSDGTFTGWSFDDWGQTGSLSGTMNGNKITVNGKSQWSTEIREIEINGNKMVQKFTLNLKGRDGKEMIVSKTIDYTKK